MHRPKSISIFVICVILIYNLPYRRRPLSATITYHHFNIVNNLFNFINAVCVRSYRCFFPSLKSFVCTHTYRDDSLATTCHFRHLLLYHSIALVLSLCLAPSLSVYALTAHPLACMTHRNLIYDIQLFFFSLCLGF